MVVNDEYSLYGRLREVLMLLTAVSFSSWSEGQGGDWANGYLSIEMAPAHLDEALFLWGQGVSVPNGRIPRYHILRDISLLQAIRLSDQPALLALAADDQDWLIRI